MARQCVHRLQGTSGDGTPQGLRVHTRAGRGVSAASQTGDVMAMTRTVRKTTVLTTRLDIVGPFDLREIATMGFGHRDERSFDGVMRMAFCLDGDYERQVGVEAEQFGDRLELRVQSAGDPLSDPAVEALRKQVARVVSLDHDGEAFHQLCLADPVLTRVHNKAPGFRPALFYSPYEAAVWSIISARRARSQGITLRNRMSELYGAEFEL